MTDPTMRNLQIKYLLANKSTLAKKRIASILRKKKFTYKQINKFRVPYIPNNTTFGKVQKLKGPFLSVHNSTFIPPVFVEKDILEWAYNFIKEQSIKFYEIFHTEVGQSQYSIKRHKFLKWLKDHHDKQNPWHTMSELTKTYVFNKLCTAKEREEILEDLISSDILEAKTKDSDGTYKPTKIYRLKLSH